MMNMSSNELRMMANAINWVLNVPFDRTPQPAFSEAQSKRLGDLLAFLHSATTCSGDAILAESRLSSPAGAIPLDADMLRTISQCVTAFSGEVGDSPEEVMAVAGLPIENLHSLQAKLPMPRPQKYHRPASLDRLAGED